MRTFVRGESKHILCRWRLRGVLVNMRKFYLIGHKSLSDSFSAMDDLAGKLRCELELFPGFTGFIAHILTSFTLSPLHNTTFGPKGAYHP